MSNPQTTPAQQLADAVWTEGNRHGADADRKLAILLICEKFIDEACGRGYEEGVRHERKQ